MSRLKVLISAYACEPGKSSEPGVGWNIVQEMSEHHDIWVITWANNRSAIEAALSQKGSRPHFFYFDLPPWVRWWHVGQRGIQLHYYLWQLGAYFVGRALHRRVGLDLVHHVTFVKYWAPSFLALLPVPFLWGPVGGGESAPRCLWRGLGFPGKSYEAIREIARWVEERDPIVRLTARRSAIALATTPETAQRLHKLGAKKVYTFGVIALSREEFLLLASNGKARQRPFRFVSIGRVVPLKGFDLGLRAFAQANLAEWEFTLIGDGPERRRLERLACSLAIAERVHFLGELPRNEALLRLCECDVLVHPSLHDSGGFVCLEAMAAGKPVICLDLGGPAMHVSEEVGIRVPPGGPEEVVRGLADAMRRLAANPAFRLNLGSNGRQRVWQSFLWETKCQRLKALYQEAVTKPH